MVAPYLVEQTSKVGEIDLIRRRFNYDTIEEAILRFSKCIDEVNATHVILCKRGVRNKRSIIKVWTASMF